MGFEELQAADEVADKALAAGGSPENDPMGHGFMYGRSFYDPEGTRLGGHLDVDAATEGRAS